MFSYIYAENLMVVSYFVTYNLKNHAKCKIVVDNLRNAWYYNIRKKQENKTNRPVAGA